MQKTITPQQLDGVIQDIITNCEKESMLKRDEFTGVPSGKFMTKFYEVMGEDWVLRKDEPVKLTDADINAVAANRFFKGKGSTLVLLWALTVSLLWMITNTYPVIPLPIFGALNAVAAFVFFYVYARKLRKVRKSLWAGIRGDNL